MKSLITVILMLCLASIAFSQTPMSIGGQVGLNLSNLSFDPSITPSPSTRTDFGVGALLEVGVSEMFFIQPELMYLTGGAKFDYTGGSSTFKYDVITIPILVKAKFTAGDIKPYVFAGPEIGFTMKSELENDPTSGTSTTVDQKDSTESMNLSVDFGAGAEYNLDAKTSLFGDLRYSLGLTNLSKAASATEKIKTTGFQIFVGVKFGI
ncbi:MAG: porin family protein [Bacteroidota bacterium]